MTAVPMLSVEQAEADEEQEQEKQIYLPINKDLRLLAYSDTDDDDRPVMVLNYEKKDKSYLLEFATESDRQNLSLALCELLYAHQKSKDPVHDQVPKPQLLEMVRATDMKTIYSATNLNELFLPEAEEVMSI
jgi:hypothetical protein